MVSIRHSGKTITGIIWRQGKIELRVELGFVEVMRAYWRSRFGCGTDLIPQD